MKKFLALLLALIMVLSLAACSNKDVLNSDDPDNSTPDAPQGTQDAPAGEMPEESFSVEMVEYYLKNKLEMSVEDIEPSFEYTVKDYCAYADDPASAAGHAVIEFTRNGGEVLDDEYNAWLEKVFAATARISDDGYNVIGYEFAGENEDASAQTTLEEAIKGFLSGWAFRLDGKFMAVYVSREYDNSKDSTLGKLFYYDAVKFDVGIGLQKSFDDTMSDAENYLAENEDEIKDAIDDFLN